MVAHCKPTDSVTTSQGPTEPEHTSVSPGPAVTHLYNDPSLGALAFLRAVMHDPSASLHHRMRAAELLMGLGQGHIGVEREPEVTIHIGGIKGMH
jgi:hypothetical protein